MWRSSYLAFHYFIVTMVIKALLKHSLLIQFVSLVDNLSYRGQLIQDRSHLQMMEGSTCLYRYAKLMPMPFYFG